MIQNKINKIKMKKVVELGVYMYKQTKLRELPGWINGLSLND